MSGSCRRHTVHYRRCRSGRIGKTRRCFRHQSGMNTHSVHDRPECRADGPPVDVTAWRRCRLLDAGFEVDLADRIARDHAIDIHALLGLVDRGCPPALAARILSPLEPVPWAP